MEEESNVLEEQQPEVADAPVAQQAAPAKKKKKKKVGLIIFLVVFLVIFVLPPAFVFIFIFDTGKMKVTYDETFDQSAWANALVMDSLDDTSTDGYAKFSITESDINNILYAPFQENEELKNYVTQFAIDIRKDSYIFNISAKFGFFETRLRINAKLSKEVVKRNGVEEEAYVFYFKDATLGKLPGMKGIIMNILRSSMTDGKGLFGSSSDFDIIPDLAHDRFLIYSSDFKRLISKTLNNGNSSFYTSFIYDFFDNDLVDIDFYSNEAMTVKVRLDKLTGNDYGEGEYVAYPMPYENTTTKLRINGAEKKLSLDVIRDALVSLVNSGAIETAEMNTVSEYLFNGYNGSNAPSCSLESIGIYDKESYKGFNVVSDFSVDDMIRDSVSQFNEYDAIKPSFVLANLTESNVNAFLHSQSFFGNKFFIGRNAENGYKSSYIAFDNAYINLTSTGAVLTAGLNINGLETIVTMLFNNDEANSGGTVLSFDVGEIYYGATGTDGERCSVSNGTKDLLFDTLKNTVQSESFTFTDNGKLNIDFTALVQQGIDLIATDMDYKDFLTNHARYEVKVVGESIEGNNPIRLTAYRKS